MQGKIITALGTIHIDEKVISTIVGNAAMKSYGIVGLVGKSGMDGFLQLLSKDNYTRGVKIIVDGNELNLVLSVVLEYGVRINVVTDNIIQTIKYEVENITGLNVKNVEVLVRSLRMEQ